MNAGKLKTVAIALVAAAGGTAFGAVLFHSQASAAAGVAEPQGAPTAAAPTATTMVAAPHAAMPAVAGSLQVTRLTDTTFVVVKDQGDAEVVTLFSTEGGIVQKKHSGRFFY